LCLLCYLADDSILVLLLGVLSRTCGAGAEQPGVEWKGVDNKSGGTTLASACVLYLDLLSHVWLRISGGLNYCQELWRGVV